MWPSMGWGVCGTKTFSALYGYLKEEEERRKKERVSERVSRKPERVMQRQMSRCTGFLRLWENLYHL